MSKKPAVYRRIYPPQEAIVFDGGLNNKYERALIEDDESPDCANVEFYNGSVATREGAVKLNTSPAGTVAFDGLYTRRGNDASETMCAFIGGHMFTLGSTTFITVPSAQSVFTIGSRVGAAMMENYLFIGNGGAGPYKWNGVNFTQHGVSAPTATHSVATGTTGSLTTNGIYQWKVTYVNSALVESDVGPVNSTFTIGAASQYAANLSSIPLAAVSAGVGSRRIYRTLTSGALFFRVATIGDNTTTTYSDVTADTGLGVAAPTDNGVPPKYNAIIYHENYLFCNDPANPNIVRYTAVNTPYTWPQLNFFRVGDNTSDLVKGFATYNTHLVVICENSVWINFMPNSADATTWRQQKTNSPYGSSSPYCMLQVKNSIFFPATQAKKFSGFASLTGAVIDQSASVQMVTTAGSDLQSDRVEADMFLLQQTYQGNFSGIVFKNRAYITTTYGSNNTTNNRVYCYDFSSSNLKKDHASWVPWTGLSIQQFTIYGGSVYGCSSLTNGFVYKILDTGVYSDDGVAIDSYFWTKEYPGYAPDSNYQKDYRYLNMLIDNAGSYSMGLAYRTNSDTSVGTTQNVDLTTTGSVWGSMVWGVSLWGGGVLQTEQRVYLGPAAGKRIQFKFSNLGIAGHRFKVHRANFAYNLKGIR